MRRLFAAMYERVSKGSEDLGEGCPYPRPEMRVTGT